MAGRHLAAVFGIALAAPLCAAELSGVVQDAAGASIANANVTLIARGERVMEGRSNAVGGYALVGLSAGAYDLEIRSPGFVDYTLSGIQLTPEDRKELTPISLAVRATGLACRSSEVAPFGPPIKYRRLPDRGGAMTGKVALADEHTAVPNARVILICPDGRVCASVTTDRDGTYRFFNLRPGVYSLRVEGSGCYVRTVDGRRIRAGFEALNPLFELESIVVCL